MEKKNHLIDITINNLDNVVSEYNTNTLSDNLGNYIYKECQGIPIKNNITLKITTDLEITEEEKKKISKAEPKAEKPKNKKDEPVKKAKKAVKSALSNKKNK